MPSKSLLVYTVSLAFLLVGLLFVSVRIYKVFIVPGMHCLAVL